MQLTPCDCDESHYRLLPRKWWMRALPSHRHYRCSSCHAHMLLKHGHHRGRRPLLLLLVALGLAIWATFHAVGYLEESRYAAERRAAESPP